MLIQSDSASIPLPDKSIHCVTTSPPYWGLRKYSGEQGRGMFPDLGLEKTPQEFIHNMVMIFREVRRVLRDDGVVWLNLGDSYSGSGGPGSQWDNMRGIRGSDDFEKFDNPNRKPGPGAGNLMLMPHRVAIALQDDGWIVRNDVVWWKRNPMPESQAGWRFEQRKEGGSTVITHEIGPSFELRKGSWRHTRAHEYVFMLTKKMKYWANQEAVREAAEYGRRDTKGAWRGGIYVNQRGPVGEDKKKLPNSVTGKNPESGRNPRSVMDVPTAPYKGAHYATFPPNLIAPLIRATCPRWACPVCGQGWSPVVEKTAELEAHRNVLGLGPKTVRGGDEGTTLHHDIYTNVKSYRPTCSHDHTKDEAVPGIVLDPFVGSGTTVMVARELQRKGIGLDISMEYLDQQAKIRAMNLTPSNALDDLPMFEYMKG